MAEAISVARPYAVAAFDEASRLNGLAVWSDLLLTGAEAVSNPEVCALIDSPRVARNQLESLMLALCGNKAGASGNNFIRVLVENQRLGLLPKIAAMFETMRAEAEKCVDVEVTSAFDLNDAQKQKIAAAMKQRLGREVRLACTTNRELLGGVVIRAGDKVIDGSAQNRLVELANALA